MKTMFFNNSFPTNSTVKLVLSNDSKILELHMRTDTGSPWTRYTNIDMGEYRLFRPDHDAQFMSDNGSVWEPKQD